MTLTLSLMEKRCASLVAGLVEHKEEYGLNIFRMDCGALVIDAGVEVQGAFEAGRLITELAQGGFCTARLSLTDISGIMLPEITVQSFYPAFSAFQLQTACEIKNVLVSGPIRLRLSADDPLINQDIPVDKAVCCGIAVIQSDSIPSRGWVEYLAEQSGCRPEGLTLVAASDQSAAGTAQIAGRVNENIIFTLEKSIGYDSLRVIQLLGSSPIAPLSSGQKRYDRAFPDDFLHYAGQAFMVLDAEPDQDMQALAASLCYRSTPSYGEFFGETLRKVNGVFMDIPGLRDINKVAEVTINDVHTGRIYHAGSRDTALLKELLALKA